jgi:hypothetical protein
MLLERQGFQKTAISQMRLMKQLVAACGLQSGFSMEDDDV